MSYLAERTKAVKHKNKPHGFAVVTRQETAMEFERLIDVVAIEGTDDYEARYEPFVF